MACRQGSTFGNSRRRNSTQQCCVVRQPIDGSLAVGIECRSKSSWKLCKHTVMWYFVCNSLIPSFSKGENPMQPMRLRSLLQSWSGMMIWFSSCWRNLRGSRFRSNGKWISKVSAEHSYRPSFQRIRISWKSSLLEVLMSTKLTPTDALPSWLLPIKEISSKRDSSWMQMPTWMPSHQESRRP